MIYTLSTTLSEYRYRRALNCGVLTAIMLVAALLSQAQFGAVHASSPPTFVVDDDVTTAEDTSIDIEILNNDGPLADLDLNSLEVLLAPSYGSYSIQLTETPTILYEPYADFWGEDLFEYRICDTGGTQCGTARVTIFVEAVNDPIEAVADLAVATTGELLKIDVLGNDTDSDLDMDIGTLTIIEAAQRGVAQVVDGQIHYTTDHLGGVDEFRYQICDVPATSSASSSCSSATAQVLIGEADQIDAQVSPNGSMNVSPAGAERLQSPIVSIARQPDHGTATAEFDGTVTYQPMAGFVGADQFLVELCDVENVCRTVSYSVTVESPLLRLPILIQ